eukprot:TRINITY_DN8704_c0_g1_i5.p1 TRINITY_DN8704_c0_g1~~TRINITY_DN8704_c0_g1_i5.p1  ORF type:complete len:239 (+),score=35.66 TRINITY_DN8704_c0_g1_i5:65-781(+)
MCIRDSINAEYMGTRLWIFSFDSCAYLSLTVCLRQQQHIYSPIQMLSRARLLTHLHSLDPKSSGRVCAGRLLNQKSIRLYNEYKNFLANEQESVFTEKRNFNTPPEFNPLYSSFDLKSYPDDKDVLVDVDKFKWKDYLMFILNPKNYSKLEPKDEFPYAAAAIAIYLVLHTIATRLWRKFFLDENILYNTTQNAKKKQAARRSIEKSKLEEDIRVNFEELATLREDFWRLTTITKQPQ